MISSTQPSYIIYYHLIRSRLPIISLSRVNIPNNKTGWPSFLWTIFPSDALPPATCKSVLHNGKRQREREATSAANCSWFCSHPASRKEMGCERTTKPPSCFPTSGYKWLRVTFGYPNLMDKHRMYYSKVSLNRWRNFASQVG